MCVPLHRVVVYSTLACLLLGSGAIARGAETGSPSAPGQAVQSSAPVAGPPPEATRSERLQEILQSIQAAKTERAEIRQRLKTAPADADKKEIEGDIARLNRRLEELQTSFEELATGGISIASLGKEVEQQPVDWKQEFEDILRPVLHELQQLTERPRKIERLRSEQSLYEGRLATADRALARLDETLQQADTARLRAPLTELKDDWTSHRADAISRLHLTEDQLARLLTPEEEAGAGIVAGLREFFSGRGLNALLAVTGFALTYWVLATAGNLVTRHALQQRETKARRLAKVGGILFRVFSVLAALLTAMTVLYVRGDWLILGLLILLLFAFMLSLRNSLPHYIDKVRILLNLGAVREGERVIYRGLPWRIKSLNIYSTLNNPLLRGGTIRVPLDDMVGLQSRQYAPEEPWFPSRESDFVMLAGDVFGKVLVQTPEIVQVQIIGATETFRVADYLSQHPRNLSMDGFAVPLNFGLDYRHQAEVLTDITSRLRRHFEERSQEQVFRPFLKDLIVDFNEAASSSLNLIIVTVFDGAAAEHYWSIRRFMQQTAVDACNRFGWTIPFDQLTLQIREGGMGLPADT